MKVKKAVSGGGPVAESMISCMFDGNHTVPELFHGKCNSYSSIPLVGSQPRPRFALHGVTTRRTTTLGKRAIDDLGFDALRSRACCDRMYCLSHGVTVIRSVTICM